jgi:hypothetical protein
MAARTHPGQVTAFSSDPRTTRRTGIDLEIGDQKLKMTVRTTKRRPLDRLIPRELGSKGEVRIKIPRETAEQSAAIG